MGNPSVYKPERDEPTLSAICDRLSQGETLSSICRDPGMPNRGAIYDWCAASEGVAQRVARARALGEEVIADDCLRIADDLRDKPESRKIRAWTRLQLLAKWNPKRWGDRVRQEITGDGGGPVQHVVVHAAVPPDQAYAQLLRGATREVPAVLPPAANAPAGSVSTRNAAIPGPPEDVTEIEPPRWHGQRRGA